MLWRHSKTIATDSNSIIDKLELIILNSKSKGDQSSIRPFSTQSSITFARLYEFLSKVPFSISRQHTNTQANLQPNKPHQPHEFMIIIILIAVIPNSNKIKFQCIAVVFLVLPFLPLLSFPSFPLLSFPNHLH